MMGFPLMSFRSSSFLPSIAGSGWTSMFPWGSSTKMYVSPCRQRLPATTEVGKGRFPFGADQLCRVLHQGNEFASLLVLVVVGGPSGAA